VRQSVRQCSSNSGELQEVGIGPFKGHGHRPELEMGGAEVFVMPGPHERVDRAAAGLEQLRSLVAE